MHPPRPTPFPSERLHGSPHRLAILCRVALSFAPGKHARIMPKFCCRQHKCVGSQVAGKPNARTCAFPALSNQTEVQNAASHAHLGVRCPLPTFSADIHLSLTWRRAPRRNERSLAHICISERKRCTISCGAGAASAQKSSIVKNRIGAEHGTQNASARPSRRRHVFVGLIYQGGTSRVYAATIPTSRLLTATATGRTLRRAPLPHCCVNHCSPPLVVGVAHI